MAADYPAFHPQNLIIHRFLHIIMRETQKELSDISSLGNLIIDFKSIQAVACGIFTCVAFHILDNS